MILPWREAWIDLPESKFVSQWPLLVAAGLSSDYAFRLNALDHWIFRVIVKADAIRMSTMEIQS